MKKTLLSVALLAVGALGYADDFVLPNAGFETWEEGVCDGWTAGTNDAGVLVQSTDARSCQSSLYIVGNSSYKRTVNTQELELPVGDYTFSCYVKAVPGNTNAKVQLGYVMLSGNSSSAKNASKVSVTSDSEWQLVEYSFNKTNSCNGYFVITLPYNCGDILVDDANLVCPDGTKIYIPPTPEPDDTALGQLKYLSGNEVVYNLCGERVQHISAPGIYFVNGRKVIKK